MDNREEDPERTRLADSQKSKTGSAPSAGLGLTPKAESRFLEDAVKGAFQPETFVGEGIEPTAEGTSVCLKHSEPLNFWSSKEQVYQCIRCLIKEEEVHYVDDSYKNTLEQFKEIKNYGRMALTENAPMASLIMEWKDDIRSMLQQVQEEFIKMINDYTNKFFKSLLHIEQSATLQPHAREDNRQRDRLEEMKARFEEISELIELVEATMPNKRAEKVRKVEERMRRLEQELVAKDKEMKKVNHQVMKAMTETVDVNNLPSKLFLKFLKFMNQQANERVQNGSDLPKSRRATWIRRMNHLQNLADQARTRDANPMTQRTKSRDPEMIVPNSPAAAGKEVAGQQPRQSDMIPLLDIYRSEKQSLFYLQPDTNNIFLMNFNKAAFFKESITGLQIPYRVSTQQTPDGKIYLVGGYRIEQANEVAPLKDCTMLDDCLQAVTRDQLQSGRFEIPLALVHDRFILAMGGRTTKQATTMRCEAYDTVTNHWFQIESLPVSSCSTSAVVLNKNQVYLMPGPSQPATTTSRPSAVVICHLDTGLPSQFPRDSDKVNYGYSLTFYRWTKLEVQSSEFIRSSPGIGLALGPTQILIFGGSTSKTFVLDARNINNGKAPMQEAPAQLTGEAQTGPVCIQSTHQAGGNFYAVDSNQKVVFHVRTDVLEFKCHPLTVLGSDI